MAIVTRLLAQITGTGTFPASGGIAITGNACLRLAGTWSATVTLERSLDNGTTWAAASDDGYGTKASFTAGIGDLIINEPADGVLYRLNCSAYTSGTVLAQITQ